MRHNTPTAGRLALIRAIGAVHLRPTVDLPPLDSMPAGEPAGGGGGGGQGDTGGGESDGGGHDTGDSDTGGGDGGDGFGSLFLEPHQTPAEVAPPENAPPAPKSLAERSLDEFPAEIRGYVKDLRDESAKNRLKAKTEAERATQASQEIETRLNEQREELIGQLLKATGLMPDFEGSDDDEPVDPAEQITQLTEQLAQRDNDHKAARLELAVWKGAHLHQANPERLTDSNRFMREIAKLDPAADDFADQVAAAIGTAVTTDSYYRAEPPAGQAPTAPPPPVPSGGDFAGGPSGGTSTEPQSVDDYRALLRKSKKRDGGSD